MITSSFVLMPGIKSQTEQRIWSQGINNWNEFLGKEKVAGIGSQRKEKLARIIQEAKRSLAKEDSEFFARTLPFKEQWRTYNSFKDNAAYIDIETNGYYGDITVIGISDGIETKTLVKGINLEKKLLTKELSKYRT